MTRLFAIAFLFAISTLSGACSKASNPAGPSSTITSSLPLASGGGGAVPITPGEVTIYTFNPISNAGPGTETVNVLFTPDDPKATGMLFATLPDAQACQKGDCSKALMTGRSLSIHEAAPAFVLAIANFSTRDLDYGFNYSYTTDK